MSFKYISIKDLKVDPLNVRKDVGDIGDLENSIEKEGILQNLVVRKKDGQLYVVVGQRRLSAAKNVGLKEVPAIIRDIENGDALALSLMENLQRGDLTPDEEADGVARLFEIHGSLRKSGDAIGKSETWIRNRLEGKGIMEKFKEVHKGVAELPHPILPQDPTKVRRITTAGKSLFPEDSKKQVELFESLRDKPDREVRRAVEYVKAKANDEPEIFDERPIRDVVEDTFKVPSIDVSITFGAKISKAIIKVAEEREISWEDVVEIAVEQWLRQGGYLG